jgi:hypothetical protein
MHKPTAVEIKEFDNSNIGKLKNKYFKKTQVIGILSIMLSLVWLILNVYNQLIWYEYFSPLILISFGMYFIIHAQTLKNREVNKYLYEQKKKKQN